MKLKSVHVRNFKCVKDSTPFKADERVTCLVGKNESGKTALLQAIHKLNPVEEEYAAFDDLREYPRTEWSDYKVVKDTQPAECLATTWELEPSDLQAVRELVGPALKSNLVTATKGYDNTRRWSLSVDEQAAAKHILQAHELLDTERAALEKAKTVQQLAVEIRALPSPSELQASLLQVIDRAFGKGTATAAVTELLAERLPRIAYFSEYHKMPGQVALEDFKRRTAAGQPEMRPSDRVFEAFLGLIGASPKNLQDIKEFERLQAELEAASSNVSRSIFKYWSQNRHLRVQVRFDNALAGDSVPFNQGYIVRTRIENTRHGSTTSFDERSAGFVWFFSFLVWFGHVRRTFGDNLLVLLDEPGLSLHARAQGDLLRYFENELGNYQLFYTTHSPFMIDPQNLLRARTVEDVFIPAKSENGQDQELGTKVGDDVLSTDRDTVFPLQACLGYEITQTLFVGKHNLLVEGPSDILYLKWFSRKLASLNRHSLDRRWTVVPCGGIDKVAAFMSLFRGNELHVAVLTDFKHGDKAKVERLRQSRLLRDGHVLSADSFANKAEADVEDIVGEDTYIDLLNKCYGLKRMHFLAALPRGHADKLKRILSRVEAHMGGLPSDVAEFDHFRPAEFLMESGLALELKQLDRAMERFESLFTALNSLLPPG